MTDIEQEIKSQKSKAGRKKGPVWNHFDEKGTKKEGHIGCKCKYCLWYQNRGEPAIMQAHLALNCSHAPYDVKMEYLLIVKTRGEKKAVKSNKRKCTESPKIDDYYESNTITPAKQLMCDRAITKFFVCCGIAFQLIEHPFFIDMVKSLCCGYEIPCSTTLSTSLLDTELANVIVDQYQTLENEKNLTLGIYCNSVNHFYKFILLISFLIK